MLVADAAPDNLWIAFVGWWQAKPSAATARLALPRPLQVAGVPCMPRLPNLPAMSKLHMN